MTATLLASRSPSKPPGASADTPHLVEVDGCTAGRIRTREYKNTQPLALRFRATLGEAPEVELALVIVPTLSCPAHETISGEPAEENLYHIHRQPTGVAVRGLQYGA